MLPTGLESIWLESLSGTPQVLGSIPRGSEFQVVVKKIPSFVPNQSTGQEPAHSQVTVPCVWMGQGFVNFLGLCEKTFFLSTIPGGWS
jgi:hypothetical protein